MPSPRPHLPVLALLCACAGGADTEDRVIDDVPVLEAREEVRIGSVDDPDIGFSSIEGVAVASDGRAYVLEAQDQQVRVYDAEGARLGVFGRQGGGPGEFRGPDALGIKGDTLWVADIGLRRITLFSLDGELITTFAMGFENLEPAEGTYVVANAHRLRSDGRVNPMTPPVIAYSPGAQRDSTLPVPRLVFDRAGMVVDTVGFEPLYRVGWRATDVRNSRVVEEHRLIPASPTPSSEPLRLFVDDVRIDILRPPLTSRDNATFTVTKVSERGDTLFSRTYRYEPVEFDAAYLDWLADDLVDTRDSTFVVTGNLAREYLDGLGLAAYQPPVTAIHAGNNGTIWLRRELGDGPTYRWLILESDGTPRGQLELPRDLEVHWTGDDVIWGALPDEFDVPWLVKYRVGQ